MVLSIWTMHSPAQSSVPDGKDLPVRVSYIALRPARWETAALTEEVNEKKNLGGLVFVYYTNTSAQPVALREWYLNERESGHYRLSGDIAWDRRYAEVLAPGQTTVQEICGVSADFQAGTRADFSVLGANWQPVGNGRGVFEPEKLRVTSMTIDSTLTKVCLHIRSFVDADILIRAISFEGKRLRSRKLSAEVVERQGHVIAELVLAEPFTAGELALVKVDAEIEGRSVSIYSHRNAYADYFPNGTWGIEEKQYADARKHHLNTMVRNGATSDPFFSRDYRSTGLKAMPHTGLYPNVDMMRDLQDHPAVAVWYIHDEPDWLYTPQLLMASHTMTKKYSIKKPTLVTLCRNVKFFEYAFIPDIPCHDHYTVTAPTTSKWPFVYGTRLEETGYYTADLKYASEPKPVWAWTQGVHLWDERPKMPLPTPDELGAQLYFNLGRGAKGNLWFTFMEEAGVRYPATKKALQQYGRIVRLLEHDLLLSDPWHGKVSAPAGIDVAGLITPDKLVVFVVNTNYRISDSAYQWTSARQVQVELTVPGWFSPTDAFDIDPVSGIMPLCWKRENRNITVKMDTLAMGKVLVFSTDRDTRKTFTQRFGQLLRVEQDQ